jgi:hypothetical protein
MLKMSRLRIRKDFIMYLELIEVIQEFKEDIIVLSGNFMVKSQMILNLVKTKLKSLIWWKNRVQRRFLY